MNYLCSKCGNSNLIQVGMIICSNCGEELPRKVEKVSEPETDHEWIGYLDISST